MILHDFRLDILFVDLVLIYRTCICVQFIIEHEFRLDIFCVVLGLIYAKYNYVQTMIQDDFRPDVFLLIWSSFMWTFFIHSARSNFYWQDQSCHTKIVCYLDKSFPPNKSASWFWAWTCQTWRFHVIKLSLALYLKWNSFKYV